MNIFTASVFNLKAGTFSVLLFTLTSASVLSLAASPEYKLPTYPFSRFFTTQEQRRELDNLRAQGNTFSREAMQESMQKTIQETKPTEGSVSGNTKLVRLSGYVQRADGQHTVWIDGRSDLTKDKTNAATPNHGKVQGGELQLRLNGNSAKLKPGQVWLIGNDVKGPKVKEAYQAAPALRKKNESNSASSQSALQSQPQNQNQKVNGASSPSAAQVDDTEEVMQQVGNQTLDSSPSAPARSLKK